VDIFVTNSVFFGRDSSVFVFCSIKQVDNRGKSADIYIKLI